MGIDGNDYTELLVPIELDSLKQRYDRNALRKVVVKHRDALEALIDRTAALANESLPELVEQARSAIDLEHQEDRNRLVSLANVNQLVKSDEIEALDTRHAALLEALQGTHARAVSVRVMFNN